jgi:plastocyanin
MPMGYKQCHLALAVIICALQAPPSAAGEKVRIAITNLAFSPADATAKVGDTIEWLNGDFVDHTATDKGGAFDIAVAAGKSVRFELKAPGTFAYYCRVHPNMTATLRVEAK